MIAFLAACMLIISLFGGYADSPNESQKRVGIRETTRNETGNTIMKVRWDFSTWFALLSPLIGTSLGILCGIRALPLKGEK
jgi:hypothetical protein